MRNWRQMAASAVALLAFGTGSVLADEAAEAFRADFLAGKLSWDDVLATAKDEGTIQFYYWGGDDNLNIWVDKIVTPALAEHGVKVVANRITSTKDAIDLVIAQEGAGKGIGEGSVDAVWVNGENFYTLKKQDMLFGAFAKSLPNSSNFDWDENDPRSLLNLRDFGVATEAKEVPWSGEQYVCAANRALLSPEDTPSTFDELKAYLEKNPGKFTYVKPPHYLGNTFVQEAVYAFNPDGTGGVPFQQSAEDLGADEIARLIAPGLDYLKALEPLLLDGQDGTARHPENADGTSAAFRNGEITINCQFGLYAVATNRSIGKYPQTAEEIVFPEGLMIKNKNYLAIPSNAPNPAAALVFANYMSSVESQVSKLKNIGYPAGIDGWMLDEADQKALEEAAPPHFGLTQADLDANIAPDTNASLVDIIEASWIQYIEQGSDKSIAEIVKDAYANLN